MDEPPSPAAQVLLDPWPGPYGGLPPWDRVTPEALEEAFRVAVAQMRAEVRAVADDPSPPTFTNTIETLEDAGRALSRLKPLLSAFSQTMATGSMPGVAGRLAPLASALDDAIAHDQTLFARIDAVHRARHAAGLTAEQVRLVDVVHERAIGGGAALPPVDRARLAAINARYAELFTTFGENLRHDEGEIVWIDEAADLDGCSDALRTMLRDAALANGRADAWALCNMRAMVWPFLTQSARRDLRERVWRLWTDRGGHAGPHDNRPIVEEILALRGEKARLFGYPSFAHWQMARRMARTPDTAIAMLERAWEPVLEATHRQIAAYQALADAEGATFALAPWDRLHYAEKLRRARFGFDSEAMRPFLSITNVFEALFWMAGRVHGHAFRDISADVPRLDESVRVYALERGGQPAGVLYVDLFARAGKGHGSYQVEWRSAESFRGRVLPISCIVSNLPKPSAHQPALVTWDYANLFFHEFGHALHMLSNGTAYPSLGPMHVAWDFIELPSLINERWLADRELLSRFARHHATGEPVSPALLEKLDAVLRFDRIFSVNLDYLADAFIDLRLHLLADGSGRPIDVEAVERETLAGLRMPAAWDLVMRVPNLWHAWTPVYAAGLYTYLWSDVMAADAAEVFEAAPGGLYDRDVALRWRETVLEVGARVPAEQAFRDFRGRDPDPEALLRRFDLSGRTKKKPASASSMYRWLPDLDSNQGHTD